MTFILSFLLSALHPFFVSVIDIKHNVKDKTIEISTKVFVDDLEAVLKKNYNVTSDLSKSTNNAAANSCVANYVQKKLQLTINDKPQTIKYIGYEIQKESVWSYAEVGDVVSLKKLSINCNLLYDYQDKQMNIFNVKANGSEKNYKLDYPKSIVEFSW